MALRLVIPLRASLLWTLLVPGGLWFGIAFGSCVLPGILELSQAGLAGLQNLKFEWYGCALTPSWIQEQRLVDSASVLLSLVFAAVFGILSERFWQHLCVKFGWVTESQLEQFKKQRQLF